NTNPTTLFWDGAPWAVGSIDSSGYSWPSDLPDIKADIITQLEETFADFNIVFTFDKPICDEYTTIYIGTFDHTSLGLLTGFDEIRGLAETVDYGNRHPRDQALVDPTHFTDPNSAVEGANVIAHEVGHLLGLNHVADQENVMSLDASGQKIGGPSPVVDS